MRTSRQSLPPQADRARQAHRETREIMVRSWSESRRREIVRRVSYVVDKRDRCTVFSVVAVEEFPC